jgi:ubiquinol-cytochrome c reductase cytochrome c subunit
MAKRAIPLTCTFVVVVMAACGQCQADDTVNPGREIYMQKGCFTCHGTVGQGGAGPRLAPSPWPVEALAAYVRNPSGSMPSYRFQITDAELVSIRAYLASVPTPSPPKELPLLRD